jgi:hypothetical protein
MAKTYDLFKTPEIMAKIEQFIDPVPNFIADLIQQQPEYDESELQDIYSSLEYMERELKRARAAINELIFG